MINLCCRISAPSNHFRWISDSIFWSLRFKQATINFSPSVIVTLIFFVPTGNSLSEITTCNAYGNNRLTQQGSDIFRKYLLDIFRFRIGCYPQGAFHLKRGNGLLIQSPVLQNPVSVMVLLMNPRSFRTHQYLEIVHHGESWSKSCFCSSEYHELVYLSNKFIHREQPNCVTLSMNLLKSAN